MATCLFNYHICVLWWAHVFNQAAQTAFVRSFVCSAIHKVIAIRSMYLEFKYNICVVKTAQYNCSVLSFFFFFSSNDTLYPLRLNLPFLYGEILWTKSKNSCKEQSSTHEESAKGSQDVQYEISSQGMNSFPETHDNDWDKMNDAVTRAGGKEAILSFVF